MLPRPLLRYVGIQLHIASTLLLFKWLNLLGLYISAGCMVCVDRAGFPACCCCFVFDWVFVLPQSDFLPCLNQI